MEPTRITTAVLGALAMLTAAGCANVTSEQPRSPKPAAAQAAAAVQASGPSTVVTSFEAPKVAAERTALAPAEPPADQPAATQTAAAGEPTKYDDVWGRIRAGYGLPALDSQLIARHEKWFAHNPQYMQAMVERARLYLYFIADEVEKRGMPMEIALLPAIESGYKPYAYSRARASGLWQFIAPTGRLYGLSMDWWQDERRDVIAATRAALDYLEKLNKDFDGDWHLALAAYNAGEGKISRMMEYNRRRGRPTDYEYLRLRRETVNYVPKLIAMANIVANPEKYGVKLMPIPNEPYFTEVDLGSQIDLGVVANLTDMSVNELQRINPQLKRWATHPEGPHRLLVPVDKKEVLLAGLDGLPRDQRVRWLGHKVKRGDTLSEIGRRYGVSVQAIRSANNLRSNFLSIGQDLMIPVSSRPLKPIRVARNRSTTRKSAWRTAGGTGPVIHRVRSGDTLWSIARRYGVLVQQIVKWNLLDANDILRLGQRLRIFPPGSAGPAAALPNPTPNG